VRPSRRQTMADVEATPEAEAVRTDDVTMEEAPSGDADEASKTPLADVDPNAYGKGKYNWSGDGDKPMKAASDVLGAKISDYAWGDGEKKASVYVTLEGLADAGDDAVVASVVAPRHVRLVVTLPSGTRSLDLQPLYADVDSVKVLRKPAKSQVVLKLLKKAPKEWFDLLGAASPDFELPEEDDDEPPMDQGFDDVELGDEPEEPAAAEEPDEPVADAAVADSFEETGEETPAETPAD